MFWRCSILLAIASTALLAGRPAQIQAPQPYSASEGLTIEEVVKLAQSGFSEEVIITKIKKNAKPFDLTTDELLELKKHGISDNIIKYLLDPSQPYSGPPPRLPVPSGPPTADTSSPSGPARTYSTDALSSKVPADPGLYYFEDTRPMKIGLKVLLGSNEGPGIGKVLMKKGKTTAYLVGSAAKARLMSPTPIFYMRLAEGKGIEDVVLVAFERKDNRREIQMGPTGPKQELKAEAIRQFDSLEVGPGLFKVTPSKLSKGEYLVFFIGSAEPPKGSQGKGYDFGIDESNRRSR